MDAFSDQNLFPKKVDNSSLARAFREKRRHFQKIVSDFLQVGLKSQVTQATAADVVAAASTTNFAKSDLPNGLTTPQK